MAVDKFGRYSDESKSSAKGPKGEGFALTSDGNYDVKNKRLCNVADPVDSEDTVNLETLRKTVEPCLRQNLKRTAYDALKHNICNVGEPVEDTDAVTQGYLFKGHGAETFWQCNKQPKSRLSRAEIDIVETRKRSE